jgi:hypothetical protein
MGSWSFDPCRKPRKIRTGAGHSVPSLTCKGEDVEEPIVESLAETENFEVWKAEEPDGEMTYHLELGVVTVHLFREEWKEFLELIKIASANATES